jgi:hypothetical protein
MNAKDDKKKKIYERGKKIYEKGKTIYTKMPSSTISWIVIGIIIIVIFYFAWRYITKNITWVL